MNFIDFLLKMKITDISKIDPEYRVLNIGKYNGYVYICPYCHPERVEFHIRDIIGFGTDNQGYVVVVDECPKCFERSYHHLYDFDTYDIFLMMQDKQAKFLNEKN